MKPINAIVAVVDKLNVIGADGDLAVYNKKDMKWFSQVTGGKIVIMGKNTMLSLKQPLRGRFNIVISPSLYKELIGYEGKVGLLSKKRLVTVIHTEKIVRPLVDFNPMKIFKYRDFYIAKDMEDAVRYANLVAEVNKIEEIFVIGGSETYTLFLPYISKLYVTIFTLPKKHILFSQLRLPDIEVKFFRHIDTRIKSSVKHAFLSIFSKEYKRYFNKGEVESRERQYADNIQLDHLVIRNKNVKDIELIL